MKEKNKHKNKNDERLKEMAIIIKEKREKAGLSETELARKLADYQVNEEMIKKWENGAEMPELTTMYGLAEELKININELLQIRSEVKKITVKRPYSENQYLGRTLWDIFGDFIINLIKIVILAGIIFLIFKSGIFAKLSKLGNSSNTQEENYVVDDEYLRMLNSKNNKFEKY